MEQFYTVFSSHMLEWGRFLHTLHFLHFEELGKEMNDDENHDRLPKIREIFLNINDCL
jgi:hypothetical protein